VEAIDGEIAAIYGEDLADAFSFRDAEESGIREVHGTVGIFFHEFADPRNIARVQGPFDTTSSPAYSPLRDPTPLCCARPPSIAEDRFRFMARGNFGERLKRERDLREVSMDELSKSTRISTRFLQALENEDWGKLPGGVFGHGFVRSIARYLGLAEESLLSEYDLARAEKLPPPPEKPEERIPSLPKWVPTAAVLVILLFLVGLFYAGRYGWRRHAAHRAAKQAAASAASPRSTPDARSISPTGSGETLSGLPLNLSISTSAATRVRILADDKLLLDSELPAGETLHFTAKQRFEVSAANSSAVLLQLNGKAMAPLGAPGASGRMVYSHSDLR